MNKETEDKLVSFQKKRQQEKDIVDQALDVNGFDSPFSFETHFDDDIFLLDNWEAEQALDYLIGVSYFAEVGEIINHDEGAQEIYPIVVTLFGDQFSDRTDSYVLKAFHKKLNRFRRLWESGNHPDVNRPSYYIDWALSKELDIPWLKYAIEKGFYKPKEPESLTQNNDKPLLPKERNTLLVIIAALAKEAKIDLSKPSKAGEAIAHLTELIGAPVDHSTIEQKIKQIYAALERRAK